MPKTTRRKKSNAAWKKLRKQHRKGPKRICLQDPRQKKGINPLTIPENVKKIQILYSENVHSELPISVVVFKRAFEQLGLRPSVDISMRRGRLSRSGTALIKTFNLFSLNDRILGDGREMRLDGIIGRCLVFTKPFDNADAIIRILPTNEEAAQALATKAHVEALFSPNKWANSDNSRDNEREYM